MMINCQCHDLCACSPEQKELQRLIDEMFARLDKEAIRYLSQRLGA